MSKKIYNAIDCGSGDYSVKTTCVINDEGDLEVNGTERLYTGRQITIDEIIALLWEKGLDADDHLQALATVFGFLEEKGFKVVKVEE